MTATTQWSARDAASMIAVPGPTDDKYSRGVLGVVTGSKQFPGAAVIGVDAALCTGVGMLRFLGPATPRRLVLARRPEAVTEPGRVQAWLVGSGVPSGEQARPALADAMASGLPLAVDAGALDHLHLATGPTVVTPHRGELAKMLAVDPAQVAADPVRAAQQLATTTGATVLIKGHLTHVIGGGRVLSVAAPTSWLATAGTGDALAGILGALVATHADEVAKVPDYLARLAATAAVIHGLAGKSAGDGGPFTVLDLNAKIGSVIAQLLRDYPEG